jgi:hypothetical protein
MSENGKIYGLIGQAMRKVGAIGKDSVNQQQKYKFRGIDAVYNALNPVMSELGLFVCPEIIDHRREERQNSNGTILKYSILTIKYTMFAPDGSNISCVVVGEGMDSGDKASNKAMSVALKYAMFQLLMIPTEEMVDPDAETHEVTSKAQTPATPQAAKQERIAAKPAQVATVAKVPQVPQAPQKQQEPQNVPADPVPPVLEYFAKEREGLRVVREISKAENNAIWKAQITALIGANLAPDKPLAEFTKQEAENLIAAMYNPQYFTPKGTVLLNGRKPS